jgi:hypothetical protein
MRRLWSAALLLPLLAVGARAEGDYVTARDRLMCTTQQSLREALRAVDTKDRALMRTVQGCHYSLEGVHAELIQDNVSMIKIKLGVPGDPNRLEFWTLPETIKPANKR